MAAATKQPRPQGISRLLRKAGFTRSTHGDPGVSYDEVTTGFVVWNTHHQNHPGQSYVAVQYDIAGGFSHLTEQEWDDYLTEAHQQLEKYAEVIRAAGYATVVRDRGDEPPWLTILTAVPSESGDGHDSS